MDEIANSIEESLFTVREIATDLFHPPVIGSGRDPGDLDPSGFEIDDEEHKIPSQACPVGHFYAEEVGGRDGGPMSFQERFPGHTSLANWIESVLEKDALDRIPADLEPQIFECAPDSRVAPARILAGHSQGQIPDFSRGSRTAGTSSSAAVVLFCDQLPVPSKESIGSHQGLDLGEPFSAGLLGLRSEPSALLIGKAEPLPVRLLPQGSVLFL